MILDSARGDGILDDLATKLFQIGVPDQLFSALVFNIF